MEIQEFNFDKGIYQFKLGEFESEFHTHPAIEIIYTESGGIDLETKNAKYVDNSLVIIEANLPHKIKITNGQNFLSMVECSSTDFQNVLNSFGILLEDGVFVQPSSQPQRQLVDDILINFNKPRSPLTTNERIQLCIEYLESSSSSFYEMMTVLKSKTHLSDSRLSHLFKDEMGISIKKYAVWCKLKRAFAIVLNEDKNMYEASLDVGFYDQAHLSKAFKQMLGIKPSKAYNSRTLQV